MATRQRSTSPVDRNNLLKTPGIDANDIISFFQEMQCVMSGVNDVVDKTPRKWNIKEPDQSVVVKMALLDKIVLAKLTPTPTSQSGSKGTNP